MKSMKTTTFIILACALLLIPLACSEDGGQKAAGDKTTTEQSEEAVQDAPFDGPEVSIGDKVVVNLTVTTPKYLYLNGPKPVSIKIPGDTKFPFSSNEFYVTKPLFPLKIDFKVPLKTPFAVHKIPLALRVMYCNKADDLCHIKNDIINVEFKVTRDRKSVQAQTVNIDETYSIK